MITLTTPTGNIGRQVLTRLLSGGADGEPVRVVVRDPSRLDPAVREQVEVVAGSHDDLDVVERAFDGADAVFWLVPPQPTAPSVDAAYVGFSEAACAVLARGSVSHVVGISALGRGTPVAGRAGNVTATLALDDRFGATGVAYRALTMPSFMDNVLRRLDQIRDEGVLAIAATGDRAAPLVASQDIAAAAAGLLTDRTWSGVAEHPVLGPEDLSPDELASTLSEVIGRPVRFEQVPTEALRAGLARAGMSEAMADAMVAMYQAKEDGLDDGVERTAETSSPTSFRQWCETVLVPRLAG